VIRAARWANVRRKFYERRTTTPVPAREALARIRRLYRVEEANLDLLPDDRRVIRQRGALP
jgi:hypothetical protein